MFFNAMRIHVNSGIFTSLRTPTATLKNLIIFMCTLGDVVPLKTAHVLRRVNVRGAINNDESKCNGHLRKSSNKEEKSCS